ncbi:MAG TPA: hypothetical protein VLK82_18770 [Candidatus Tectomicrobia bacterium]|nr:hypothetical protein [Candidatus Tectomicrobia bacterium]
MDRSDRLRDDQEKLNRKREYQEQDRRSFMRSAKTQLRIDDLNSRIEAERQRKLDEALDEMWAQWPITRAAIENCTAVTAALRETWLDRLESIKNTGKRSASSQLHDLESEMNRVADGLSQIVQELDRAAERRNPSPLATFLPWPPREPVRSRPNRRLLDSLLLNLPTEELPLREPVRSQPNPSPFDLPQFNSLAEDLQPIQDRLLVVAGVPVRLSADWLYQLTRIDLPGRIAPGSPFEKARNLAGTIKAVHANIRSVASAVGYQATKCRLYWNV